ncbi:S41 family peptidase [Embleya scabrispora]|uniref:S41 family peptidase n=1 Tax=Embleya scabrispora TaxID=159449 RepID=UPI001F26FC9B|nr:S41 family peptidase [Embleya scabrispora]
MLALAGVLLTVTGTPAGALTGSSGPPGPGDREATADANRRSLDGFWRVDGYGLVLGIAGGELQPYETTKAGCLRSAPAHRVGGADPDGTIHFADMDGGVYLVRPAVRHGGAASLRFEGSLGTHALRRLGAPPATCRVPTAADPLTTFDVFWETFRENYAFFGTRGVDWEAMRAEQRPKITAATTENQLFDILAAMIEPLHDAHVGLRAETATINRVAHWLRPDTLGPSSELDAKVQALVERRDLGGVPLRMFANGAIGYADLPGGLGYLRITRFDGYTTGAGGYPADAAELACALDDIITSARVSGPTAWRGLIVDDRVNSGGADPLGLQIAARLTDRPYLAYIKQARNDPDDARAFTRPQPFRVEPAVHVPRYTGPVALLTAGSTVSAGETFAQALIGRPTTTTRIGDNTQGIFSDLLGRLLPNGWQFSLSNERFLTRTGRSFEGPGIPPDIRTPVFTDDEFANDRDSAFDRARALLTGTPTRP